MKRIVVLIFSLFQFVIAFSQSPQGFSYQAVIRDLNGQPLAEQEVSLRITLQHESGAPVHYAETHALTTSPQGVVSLAVGNGTAVAGEFDQIPWSETNINLKVEVDASGGANYAVLGITKLQAVPYALYALSGTEGPQGEAGADGVGISSIVHNADGTLTINLTDDTFYTTEDLTGPEGPVVNGSSGQTLRHGAETWEATSAVFIDNAQKVGIGTTSPTQKLEVAGNVLANQFIVPKPEGYDDLLFAVRNSKDEIVFAVYESGVRIYVDHKDEEGSNKSTRSGFAIGGLTEVGKEDGPYLLQVNRAGTTVRFDETSSKSTRSGFAIGGLTDVGKAINYEYFNVTPVGTTVRFDDQIVDDGGKSTRSGFAIGGLTDVNKAIKNEYLTVTPANTTVRFDENASKSTRSGFAIGGLTDVVKSDNTDYFNIDTDATGVVNNEARILWYPLKNAFLAGLVNIETPDDVGENSMAMGYKNKAMGDYSQAFGYQSQAQGAYSTAIGKNAIAQSNNSFAFGDGANAGALNSYALGLNAQATGVDAFAFGANTQSSGIGSFAIGFIGELPGEGWTEPTVASGDFSVAIGMGSNSTAKGSFALGIESVADGNYSISLGWGTQSSSEGSVALGHFTRARGVHSTAMGSGSIADGQNSLAASGAWSKGYESIAIGSACGAEGNNSTAIGFQNTANGIASTAIGHLNTANGNYSISIGRGNQANSFMATHMGSYGVISTGNPTAWVENEPIFVIGNGQGNTTRSNALIVLKSGQIGVNSGTSTLYDRMTIKADDDENALRVYVGNTTRLRVHGNGSVSIGSNSSGGSNGDLYVDGNTGMGRYAPANRLEVEGNASKTTSGSWLANSDERIKTQITDIDNALETIMSIRPVKFKYTQEWIEKNPSIEKFFYYNFVAQEYMKVFPDAVKGSGEYLDGDPNEILQIDTHNANIIAIKAIQEQQLIISSQQSEIDKINQLEKENKDLKARLERLERLIMEK